MITKSLIHSKINLLLRFEKVDCNGQYSFVETIDNYRNSIKDNGFEPRADVGINEQKIIELIRLNNRITAKEIAENLSISLRKSKMATLKEKNLIKRVGSNKSGHWEIIVH